MDHLEDAFTIPHQSIPHVCEQNVYGGLPEGHASDPASGPFDTIEWRNVQMGMDSGGLIQLLGVSSM